jgi:trimeric autotransporter adhesin
MNKSFKSVMNKSTGTYVAAGENAKSKGKSSKNKLATGLASASMAISAAAAMLSPVEGSAQNVAYIGSESDGKDSCSRDGGNMKTCAPWASDFTNVSGTRFSYLTSKDGMDEGGVWAGNLSSGMFFGNGPAGMNAVVLDANGTTISGTNLTLKSTNGIDVTSSKIVNVAAGDATSATSTDAVNGGQLFATNENVKANTNDIATNTTDIAKNATDIGTINTQVGDLNTRIADAVKYDTPAHDTLKLSGTAGTKISNVANGTISLTSMDAVNGSQLFHLTDGTAVVNSAYIKVNGANNGTDNAKATGTEAIAIGHSASVIDNLGGGIALGAGATVFPGGYYGGMALGEGARATGGVAIGKDANATAYAVAMGRDANASGMYSTSLGNRAVATQSGAIAIGLAANATGSGSVALGPNSIASGQNSVAIGYASVADAAGTVSMGAVGSERKIVNVKAGDATSASSTDAVNGGQLFTTNENVKTNTNDITTNTTDIATNTTNITKNSTDIGTLNTQVGTINTQVGDLNTRIADAVQYDTTAHDTLKLSGTAGTTISNVAAGTQSSDAVNVSQLSSVVNTLGGGAALNSDGTVKAPSYMVGGKAQVTVGAAISELDTNVSKLSATVADFGDGSSKYLATNAAAGNSSGASAVGAGSIAIGGHATADSTGGTAASIAIGSDSLAKAHSATVIGPGATATATNTVVLGTLSIADRTGTVSIGSSSNRRQLVNLAAGTQDTDAVNLAQLKLAGLTTDIAGVFTNSFVAYDTTSKDLLTLGGTAGTKITNLADGDVLESSKDAITGSQLYAVKQSVDSQGAALAEAVAYDSAAHDVITIGGTSGATIRGVKAGEISDSSTDAVNGAQLNTVVQNVKRNTDDIASLNSSMSDFSNGFSGLARQDVLTRSISIGANTDGNSISMAGTQGARTVSGLANGAIDASSTDAVNGAQLAQVSASTAAALGGGSSMDANGSVSAPTYTVGGTQVHDVGSAFDNIDGRVTQNSADIAGMKGDIIAVANGINPNAVNYDSTDHNKVTLGGTAATDGVQLTNVKAGELSSTSTDAINGAQLNATNERVGVTETAIADYQAAGLGYMTISSSAASGSKPVASGQDAVAIGVNAVASGSNSVALGANSVADEANTVSVGSAGNERRVTNVAAGVSGTDGVNMVQMNQLRQDVGRSMTALQRSAYGGVAAAMAMPNPTPSAPGKTVVGAGVANYKGYSAIAAGVTHRSANGKWLTSGAVAATPGGDAGVRAHVDYEF